MQVLFQSLGRSLEPPSTGPQRILLVRLSHLGDVVSTLPVFHALRRAFPRARIGWAVERAFADLLRDLPGLDATIELDRRGGLRAWLDFERELRGFAADCSVDCQGNFKSALASLLSGSATRLAHHAFDWQEPAAALSATRRAERAVRRPSARSSAKPSAHPADRALALARLATGRRLEPADLRFDPGLSEREREDGRSELRRIWPAAQAGSVLLLVSAPGDPRSWPLERWIELARSLTSRGRSWLALSGPLEAQAGRRLRDALASSPAQSGVHWIDQRGLRQAAAFFHACAERGVLGVGIDSGPMHLASACGISMRVLEGPQAAERTGPWPRIGAKGSPHRAVRAPLGPACAPCFARRCHHPQGNLCMRAIEVEGVLRELDCAVPCA